LATPYSDIYTKFNILVEDPDLLALLTDEEYESLLEIFLSKAKSVYFKICAVDLTDVNSTTKQFNQTIDDQSQWIIAEAMRYIWLERQIYKENKLRDKLSTKDYSRHSNGNLLDKLIVLKNDTRKNLEAMIVSYSFDSFTGFN
jgi:hypothetical protein